ncbi:MAG: hypothetical protein AAF721_17805, partial [Myxococcota bacterium]
MAFCGVVVIGCDPEPDTPEAEGSTSQVAVGSDTTAAPQPGTSSDDGTSPPVTTIAADSSSDDGSSTTNTIPPGPGCSVQQVTEGELLDPLEKGDAAGMIPLGVGEALEDYCGCHTLQSNNQNLKYMFLRAPGGSLFLNYGDLSGSLGQDVASEILARTMPPGSCSFPDEPDVLLTKWAEDGLPDGATFEY